MLRVARKFANTSSLVRDFVFSSLSLDAFFFYASLTKCGPLGSKEIGREKFPIDGAPGAVLFGSFFFPFREENEFERNWYLARFCFILRRTRRMALTFPYSFLFFFQTQ